MSYPEMKSITKFFQNATISTDQLEKDCDGAGKLLRFETKEWGFLVNKKKQIGTERKKTKTRIVKKPILFLDLSFLKSDFNSP